ncbi:MAG: 50S ribosomal protein L11 methyltransferase [Schleiferiaceae bacterium]|nr:50S ribosomal protein L11 methyltransferase [Schleiferiaceae bacterium]
MNYVELTFTCDSLLTAELLMADLDALPVESVTTEGKVIKAYIEESRYSAFGFEDFPISTSAGRLSWTVNKIAHQNWNQEWESNFPALMIGEDLLIRAPFHTDPDPADFRYVIQMVPKMAFGTGHHPTTYLMMEAVLEEEKSGRIQGARILDMGCGTAILAVLALQAGASTAVGIEIDSFAAENAQEISELHGMQDRLAVLAGDASLLAPGAPGEGPYDLVYANINRNILLADMEHYASVMAPGGILYLSGFYAADVPTLLECAKRCGYQSKGEASKDGWMRLTLEYQTHVPN